MIAYVFCQMYRIWEKNFRQKERKVISRSINTRNLSVKRVGFQDRRDELKAFSCLEHLKRRLTLTVTVIPVIQRNIQESFNQKATRQKTSHICRVSCQVRQPTLLAIGRSRRIYCYNAAAVRDQYAFNALGDAPQCRRITTLLHSARWTMSIAFRNEKNQSFLPVEKA